MIPAPLILTLTDGGAGNIAQAFGLARHIAVLSGGEVKQNIVVAPAFANLLPPAWGAALRLCKTDVGEMRAQIVIGCGIKSQAAVLATKRQSGAFAVCVQRPRANAQQFDAIVAPCHSYSAAELQTMDEQPGGVLAVVGSVGQTDIAMLRAKRAAARQRFAHIPDPKIGVLIGGANRAFAMTPQVCMQMAAEILRAAPTGGVLATASRRTGADNQRALAAAFGGDNCFFYDGDGADNPYWDILAASERILVTGDSVNMLSEACTVAKPTHIIRLPQKSARAARKFYRFYDSLIARGVARYWDGDFASWVSPGLDETARAAKFVWARYCAQRS